MVEIILQPTQLRAGHDNELTLQVSNPGQKICTGLFFRLDLPRSFFLPSGLFKINGLQLEAGQSKTYQLLVHPEQPGVCEATSTNFSYNLDGLPQRRTDWSQRLEVMPMPQPIASVEVASTPPNSPNARLTPQERTSLRQYLNQRFSQDELETLIFDMGFDTDNFPRQTKEQLIPKLVAFLEREDKLSDLLELTLRQRNDVNIRILFNQLNQKHFNSQRQNEPKGNPFPNNELEPQYYYPDLSDPIRVFEFSQKLSNCEAIRDKDKRRLVRRLLPKEIDQNIHEDGMLATQAFNITETCARYPDGLRQLIQAVRTIEGATETRVALDDYLRSLPR